MKFLLYPSGYDRMHYKSILSLNPGRSTTIFLNEIPVKGYTLKDVPALRQKVYDIMEAKLIKYKAKWIE